MSYITDTLRACECMLERAARNGFEVNVEGTAHGATKTRHQARRHRNTRVQLAERRRQIAQMLRETGLTQTEVAARAGCGKSLVCHIAGLLRKGIRLHAS